MDEHVLLAIVRRDEAEAALVIETFYCAVEAHGIVLSRGVSLERALWRLGHSVS